MQMRTEHFTSDAINTPEEANDGSIPTEGDGSPIPPNVFLYVKRRSSEIKLVCLGAEHAHKAAMQAANAQYAPVGNDNRLSA